MNAYSLSGSEMNRKNELMSVSKRALFSTIAAVGLAVSFTVVGGAAADAAPSVATTASTSNDSCWLDITSGQSLCVAPGVDLVAAVASSTGINISVPTGTPVNNAKTTSAHASISALSTSAASTSTVVSAIYDDINYGGTTFFMTVSGTGCGWTVNSLTSYSWNDRASSFKSFNGCTTALFKNINLGGTKIGYSTSKASLGTMNDAASSWSTD
jgi:hypothetical protein